MIRTDVRLGWKSIPGHRHQVEGRENEDAVLTVQEHPYFDVLMFLSDGMGGHPEPRRASQTAVGAARDFLLRPERLRELRERRTDAAALLCRAVEHANEQVRRLAARVSTGGPMEKPPGCTLTVAAISDGRLAVAHVGDGSVLLLRDEQLRPLAGGEARRFGSRPEEFLGRGDRIEIETAADTVRSGDRLLLCTDGLTRYFGQSPSLHGEALRPAGARSVTTSGLDRLQQVVSRLSADPQALASQLTADGRGEQYEDDTSVIVAEIGASREVPVPDPGREPERGAAMDTARPATTTRPASSSSFLLPTVLALLALIGAGLFWWRPWRAWLRPEPPAFRPVSAPAVDLSGLPKGGVFLVDRESGRVFVLRTRPAGTPAANEPLTLSELRYQPGKGVVDTLNTYRYDPARGRLTDPNGRAYPVTVDGGSGVIEIQQAGTLRVDGPPGLRVLIDGLAAGPTPVFVKVRAGRHQVQVRGRGTGASNVLYDAPVEIPPGATLSIPIARSGSGGTGGRGRR